MVGKWFYCAQLCVDSCQLSVVSCQLSIVSCQLSVDSRKVVLLRSIVR
ncbi:MAG: hypothetical protein ACKO8W_04330 [Dolichospermum sp.]